MPLSTISPSLVGDNSIADASKQPAGEGIGLKNSYHELFTYNPDTGDLIWKPRPRAHFNTDKGHKAFNTRYAGTVAGNKQVRDNGDPQSINVRLGKLAPGIHRAHRVIVKMVDGSLPDDVLIDHRDGNPWNNRWKNLRRADSADNQYNSKLRRDNKSGLKGVYWCNTRKKYGSCINVQGKRRFLGHYATKGLAGVARAKAALRYHGQFARLT